MWALYCLFCNVGKAWVVFKVVSENCNKTKKRKKKHVIFYTDPDIAPVARASGFVLLYECSV